MANNNDSKTEPVVANNASSTHEQWPGYGWFTYRPKYLQSCLSGRWILFCCCLLIFCQSFVVSGLTGVVATSIEKRYYLRSSQFGLISSFYDIGNTILTIVVSYFGYSHKPKWLGTGSLVLGLGCLIFTLPQALVSSYEPTVSQTSDLCQNNQTFFNGTGAGETDCRDYKWYIMLTFVAGQIVIGAASSPIYNLGSAYVDENVSRKNSGLYLGIYYSVAACGSGIGFILGGYFLAIYVDVQLPEGVELKQDDNSWIGAWWLGYIFGGMCALLASIPLLGFPRQIHHVKSLGEQKMKAKDSVPDDRQPHTAGQFLPALKSLFTNKVFLFTTIAGTAESFAIGGTSTFFPKFLQSQFHLKSSSASLYAGVVIIPGGILGMLLGGYLIRKFKWTCGQCVKGCTLIAFLAVFPIFIYTVHCPNQDFAGVTTPYFNSSTYDSLDACSAMYNCSCKQDNYIPVCTKEDQITYFSPCHAGCKEQTKQGSEKIYTNCSCLPANITVAHDGGCIESCNALAYFLAVMFVLICMTFCNNIPATTVTLRCVPESKGSFALGVQQIITRVFAFIPAPIVYGALLDSVCILFETDPCDEDVERNCLEYRNTGLSNVFLATTMICKVISLSFFALAWFVYKPPVDIRESRLDLVPNDNTASNLDGEVKNQKPKPVTSAV